MVSRAMEALEVLKREMDASTVEADEGLTFDAEVINVRFLMPLDKETILKSIKKTKKVIIIEDNIIEGGLGTKIQELIIEENLQDVKCLKIAYPVDFIKQGSVDEIEEKYGLDKKSIAKNLKMLYNSIDEFWEGMNF